MLVTGRSLIKTESLLWGLNLLLHTQLGTVLFLRVYRRDISAPSPSQRRSALLKHRRSAHRAGLAFGARYLQLLSSRYRRALAAGLELLSY